MGSFSAVHWLVVIVVVLLLFGGGRISGAMGDFGKGIKAFKRGLKDEEVEPSSSTHKTIDNAAKDKDEASKV